MVVHTPYMSQDEINAARRQEDALRRVKEISQQQAVIINQLEQLIRGAPPDAIKKRIAEASEEYGARLEWLLDTYSQRRIPDMRRR